MNSKQILTLLGCTAVFAWFAPDLSGSDEADSASDAGGRFGQADSQAAALQSWNVGQAVLHREADGHFYANVGVEGSQYRFLVDTGASMVALTGADAEAMGLYWDEASVRQIGRGASGAVYGVPVRIPRMDVGGFEARNVEAAIIPEGLGISLLGQSYLSRIDNVEISDDEMRLGG
jgi:aspartyl protease family protein